MRNNFKKHDGFRHTKKQEKHARENWDVHLVVKDLALRIAGLGDEVRLEDLDDVVANVRELLLDLAAVLEDASNVLVIALRLLLLAKKGTPDNVRNRAHEAERARTLSLTEVTMRHDARRAPMTFL